MEEKNPIAKYRQTVTVKKSLYDDDDDDWYLLYFILKQKIQY